MLGWLWGVGDTCLSEFFRTSPRATRFGIMVGGGRVVLIAGPYLVGWGHRDIRPDDPVPSDLGAMAGHDHRLFAGSRDVRPGAGGDPTLGQNYRKQRASSLGTSIGEHCYGSVSRLWPAF